MIFYQITKPYGDSDKGPEDCSVIRIFHNAS